MALTELSLRERRTNGDLLSARIPVCKIAAEIGRHRGPGHMLRQDIQAGGPDLSRRAGLATAPRDRRHRTAWLSTTFDGESFASALAMPDYGRNRGIILVPDGMMKNRTEHMRL